MCRGADGRREMGAGRRAGRLSKRATLSTARMRLRTSIVCRPPRGEEGSDGYIIPVIASLCGARLRMRYHSG